MRKKIIYSILSVALLTNTSLVLANPIQYEVEQGDTYWKISQKYKLDMEELIKVNDAITTDLNIGDIIELTESEEYDLYQVKSGDTYWKISDRYNMDLGTLLRINNAENNSELNIDDVIKLTKQNSNYKTHTVKAGDTYWIISQAYSVGINDLLELNNAVNNHELNIGDVIKIPNSNELPTNPEKPTNPDKDEQPYVTFIEHRIQSGDDFWNLSIKYGIPQYELMNVNNMDENTILYENQILKIPVHHIPVQDTNGPQFGEYLDWWTQAQYVVPINAVFTVTDFETGVTWKMKRTVGANHADCEPLTAEDTKIMKSVWGGDFSWVIRSILVEYNGRKIAASATSMPHSDYDYIDDNGVYGHMDIHFKNSTRHKDGQINPDHQSAIKVSAGVLH